MLNGVTVAFNDEFTAVAADLQTVFVYDNQAAGDAITTIFQDPHIVKFIVKPPAALKRFLHPIIPVNYKELTRGMAWSTIHQMNSELVQLGDQLELDRAQNQWVQVHSLDWIAAQVALTMMKYKVLAEQSTPKPSSFNQKRDCILLYLTAYNDLLSQYGPMPFTDLVRRVKTYPHLCRTEMNPALALEGLVARGALKNDPVTANIAIP